MPYWCCSSDFTGIWVLFRYSWSTWVAVGYLASQRLLEATGRAVHGMIDDNDMAPYRGV